MYIFIEKNYYIITRLGTSFLDMDRILTRKLEDQTLSKLIAKKFFLSMALWGGGRVNVIIV